MMLLRLAWRNIWRNRRRSLIIVSSVVVGLTSIVFIESWARGFMIQSLQNQLATHIAHIQIHRTGYHGNPDIGSFIDRPDVVDSVLAAERRINASSRRMLVQGLLSSARNSSGVVLVGIEPDRERGVTSIQRSIVAGRTLGSDPHEILLSQRMANTLDVGLGDKLVAMSSTKDGRVGSELFRIVGLYRTPISEFDRFHAYVPFLAAQELVQTGNDVTEFALLLASTEDLNPVKDSLQSLLGPTFEVLSYEDLIPTIVLTVEVTEQSMVFYYVIVGVAMIFGIINTMMMSVYERIREFGVLKAVGMRDWTLFRMVLLEAGLLGSVGTFIGILLGTSVSLYLAHTGINFAWFSEGLSYWGSGAIIYPVIDPATPVKGGMIIVAMCVAAALHPALKTVRLQPVDAIRHI